jgi:hypothetical protein
VLTTDPAKRVGGVFPLDMATDYCPNKVLMGGKTIAASAVESSAGSFPIYIVEALVGSDIMEAAECSGW